MNIVIATLGPYLRSSIARQLELGPYYLIVDTHAGKMNVFPHPVPFQAECSPTGLLEHLLRFEPEVILAGSFSTEVRQALLDQRILLRQANGRACDALDYCVDMAARELTALTL